MVSDMPDPPPVAPSSSLVHGGTDWWSRSVLDFSRWVGAERAHENVDQALTSWLVHRETRGDGAAVANSVRQLPHRAAEGGTALGLKRR